MTDILIVGAGVVGLGTALLLAQDGYQVTVLERDRQPPPELASEAWTAWERRGVSQFRLPHFFLARFRTVLDQQLPQVAQAIETAGGLRYNPLLALPEAVEGWSAPRTRHWRCSRAAGRWSSPPWPTRPSPTPASPSGAVWPSPGS